MNLIVKCYQKIYWIINAIFLCEMTDIKIQEKFNNTFSFFLFPSFFITLHFIIKEVLLIKLWIYLIYFQALFLPSSTYFIGTVALVQMQRSPEGDCHSWYQLCNWAPCSLCCLSNESAAASHKAVVWACLNGHACFQPFWVGVERDTDMWNYKPGGPLIRWDCL